MPIDFSSISRMTPQEIAEGRAQAKREYDAKMAVFAAVENLQTATSQLQAPYLAAGQQGTQMPPLPLTAGAEAQRGATDDAPHSPGLLGVSDLLGMTVEETIRIANTPGAFQRLDLLKDKILLVLYQSGAVFPSAIVSQLVEVGAVDADYPANHISPKLSLYRESGLVEQTAAGWRITLAGRDRVLRAIMMKGPDRAI